MTIIHDKDLQKWILEVKKKPTFIEQENGGHAILKRYIALHRIKYFKQDLPK